MGTLFYFLKETFRGFLQAKLMTFVSIMTIAITLFFMGCIIVGGLSVRRWLDNTSKKANVIVYLEDELFEDSVKCDSLIQEVKGFEEVDSLYLVGKDEAWEEFERNYGPEMLDAVSDNPLPARIDITLNRKLIYADAVGTLKSKLQGFEGIEGVNYSYELLSVLQRFNRIFITGASIIVVLLLFALHFMISNTVKLTIYARKDLIINMQYVGATDFFIKAPFVLEGILQGMIGGVIAISSLWIVRLFLYRFSLYWGEWYFFPAIFSVGVLFGWIGSMSAVRRFLR